MTRSKSDFFADVFIGSLVMVCLLTLASFVIEFWRASERLDRHNEAADLRRQITELRAELDARRRDEAKGDDLPRIPPQNLPTTQPQN